jgi:hypothetical protein
MLISGEVLDWKFYNENSSGLTDEDEERIVWRAHDIWQHAASLIAPDCSEFLRADVITGLKRAINHRLKALSHNYCFSDLPFSHKNKTLEKFQFYGIIRPILLKELFEVRNSIEHGDVSPPTVDQCSRYVDLVWYFLKSTDSLLKMKLEDAVFWSDDHSELRFCPEFSGKWSITIRGKILSQYLLGNWQPGAIEIDESVERPEYIKTPIYGLWKPTSAQLCTFAKNYFGLSGYWWSGGI